MDGRAISGRREDANGREELMEIFPDTMEQGILRRREGGKKPRKRIAHGRASPRASEFVS
jgi:hypothetical protein